MNNSGSTTYLRTYMNALIDMRSRTIVGWSLSNSLDAESCLRTLEKALYKYLRPEGVNSDQGSQYTGDDWIKAFKREWYFD